MLSPFLNARLQFSVHESVLEKPWILVKMNIPASALRLLLGREKCPCYFKGTRETLAPTPFYSGDYFKVGNISR